MKVCSLFSGIGGFELGLSKAGFKTILMCENDPASQAVLKTRFPKIELANDVRNLRFLPKCDLLTAGWPCQDLSQAGRMAGHSGSKSKLVSEVFRLVARSNPKPEYILLENVAFALHLDGGSAIWRVVKALEELGYSWAYRILDTRDFGLPQRRRRLFIVGSLKGNASQILFDGIFRSEAHEIKDPKRFGFYWTEGNRGLGWSPESIPPLKGGSGLSIPSPPAIWDSQKRTFYCPGIIDAERLQGFSQNWTLPASNTDAGPRSRWRLVGNAVSVPVIKWIGARIANCSETKIIPLDLRNKSTRSFNSAIGGPRQSTIVFACHEGPQTDKKIALEIFGLKAPQPLSIRAAKGFLTRLQSSSLFKQPGFVRDLERYSKQPPTA